jgi:translation initiation factor IF-3
MRHPDIGRKLLDEIAEVLKGSATIERSPMMEGRMMSMIVSRAPGWEPPKKQVVPSVAKQSTAQSTTMPTPVHVPEDDDTAKTE